MRAAAGDGNSVTMLAQICRENLIAVADAYARARKKPMTLAQVSRKFYGSSAFLDEFKRGEKSITIDKLDDMLAAFRAEWPENGAWPVLRAVVVERPGKK